MLTIDEYRGAVADSLMNGSSHNFSTFDTINNTSSVCAFEMGSGWWWWLPSIDGYEFFYSNKSNVNKFPIFIPNKKI